MKGLKNDMAKKQNKELLGKEDIQFLPQENKEKQRDEFQRH